MENRGGSNNTNKLSPQELKCLCSITLVSSNNTNKLSPQERKDSQTFAYSVQIIQINLVLKNVVKCARHIIVFK